MEWLSARYRNGNVHRNFKSDIYWHDIFECDRVSWKKESMAMNNNDVYNSMFVVMFTVKSNKREAAEV